MDLAIRLGIAAVAVIVIVLSLAWFGALEGRPDSGMAVLIVLGIVGVKALIGFAWGRWKTLVVVAVLAVVPTVVLDALYFGLGFNPSGVYCGEPKCDPGPIPMSIMLILLPVALAGVALGVVARSLSQQKSVA